MKTNNAAKWLEALKASENDASDKSWRARSKKIVKRYRDDDRNLFSGSRFNILWSNVETLGPAIYSRPPQAEVSRRNKDRDPVARTASQILERALQYEIEHYPDFDEALSSAVQDRLLCGRGTVWVRYEKNDSEAVDPGSGDVVVSEEIIDRACVDYVYWEDFRTGHARKWADVPWIARREYLTREEGKKRFGDDFKDVPMKFEPDGLTDEARESGAHESEKTAAVWEIWCKRSKTVYWVAEGYQELLDEKEDPYGLDEFFPCPKPLYATQTNDRLTPVPDFLLYQDQADEIDLLSNRIAGLCEALKLNGAYDSANPDLSRILSSEPNTVIPVENWAGLSEKGGLAGVMQWVPIKEVVAALQSAYLAREQAKQVVYEITGIADIIRGATKASETFGAQDIKRRFANLRLLPRQRQVAVFATEILRIKAQIMMDVYRPESLIAMSGIDQTQDAPLAPAAIDMMQSEPLRSYQISVATDSLISIDEEQEKTQRMEFLQAIGGYIQQATQAVQTVPELAPLAMDLMMFAVRAFPAAKSVEASFEQFEAAVRNKPPPDPSAGQQAAMAEMQAKMQMEQMKLQQDMQFKQAELQADAQANQIRAQADIQIQQSKMQMQAQLEQQRSAMQAEIDRYRAEVDAQSKQAIAAMQQDFQRWKAELDASVKIQVANIGSKAKVDNAATQTATAEIAREVQQ